MSVDYACHRAGGSAWADGRCPFRQPHLPSAGGICQDGGVAQQALRNLYQHLSVRVLGPPMRVLLVNKFLYPKGGDAICTLSTGRLLAEKGHQVSYWGMAHPDNPPYPHANLFVDYVDLADGGGAVRQIRAALNILYSREAKRKFRRVIDAERPDVVHLHNFAHQISPSILDVLDEYAIPVVMTMHDYKLACPAYTLLADGKLCERCAGGRYYW